MMFMEELKPTLWRTCRVLAHPKRLEMLHALIDRSPQTVAQVAGLVHLPLPATSIALRALGARGLLRATPKGKYVFYAPVPNPAVANAELLLKAVARALAEEMDYAEISHFVTAFTHERRIRIVREIKENASTIPELGLRTGISVPALMRHLTKLESREMIALKEASCELNIPTNSFAASLLLIALK